MMGREPSCLESISRLRVVSTQGEGYIAVVFAAELKKLNYLNEALLDGQMANLTRGDYAADMGLPRSCIVKPKQGHGNNVKRLDGAVCVGLVVNIDKSEELNIIVLFHKGFAHQRSSNVQFRTSMFGNRSLMSHRLTSTYDVTPNV